MGTTKAGVVVGKVFHAVKRDEILFVSPVYRSRADSHSAGP